MQNYVCTACAYTYDPEEGDPDGGIAPVHLLKIFQMTGSVSLRRDKDQFESE